MPTIEKTYRVYCFDGVNKIVSADMLQAVSDEDAIAQAEARGFGTKCEIWEGQCLVAQLQEARLQA
jgi:hypothetical protein